MKGTFAALAGGVATALGFAAAWELKQGRGINREKLRRAVAGAKDTAQAVTEIDINTARREQLAALPGVSGELADRIMDNRPYRNKLDLLSRLIVSGDVYNSIKRRLHVDGSNDAVKTAS
ncbi:MAG TPA: helix-hairpin-helix domain-containing protein [Terriglobales bacterium]|nr:helix-hairpin-helix domain-containing protein [Terriglobales bacterium]